MDECKDGVLAEDDGFSDACAQDDACGELDAFAKVLDRLLEQLDQLQRRPCDADAMRVARLAQARLLALRAAGGGTDFVFAYKGPLAFWVSKSGFEALLPRMRARVALGELPFEVSRYHFYNKMLRTRNKIVVVVDEGGETARGHVFDLATRAWGARFSYDNGRRNYSGDSLKFSTVFERDWLAAVKDGRLLVIDLTSPVPECHDSGDITREDMPGRVWAVMNCPGPDIVLASLVLGNAATECKRQHSENWLRPKADVGLSAAWHPAGFPPSGR
jgi:hypothetical protein